MSDSAMAYIGRKACGCCVAAAVDKPEYRKDTAKHLADWVRGGLTVEHVPAEQARAALKACHHDEKQMQLSV